MNHFIKVIFILFILVGCNEKFDKTQASSDVIIDALNRYKQDHGFFPERLQDVTPSYLVEIPKSAYDDREFIYEKSDASYQLIYLGAFGAEATYHSASKEWTYDD